MARANRPAYQLGQQLAVAVLCIPKVPVGSPCSILEIRKGRAADGYSHRYRVAVCGRDDVWLYEDHLGPIDDAQEAR